MSAFYDLASLVVVPSGYKASKVYAQKPLTTDGQLAFTRSTTATRVNSAGLIESVAINVPRLDYLNSSCPRLLLEPQRTNLFQYSEQLDDAYWSKIGAITVSANNATSPDGYQNADLVTGAASGARIQRAFTGLTAGTRTLSCFVKAGTGTEVTINTYDGIVDKGAAFNVVTGVVTSTSAGATATITNYGSGWYRLTHTYTSAGTSYSCQFFFDAGLTYQVYGFQFEDSASYATSYIPTLGAAVTRGADACYKENIAGTLPTAYPFTLYAEGFLRENNEVLLGVIDISAADIYYHIGASTNGFFATARNSSTSLAITTSGRSVGTHKVAAVFTSSEIRLFANGALIATGANAQVFNPTANDVLLGQLRTNSDLGLRSSVNQALVFKSALSDAEAIALTA